MTNETPEEREANDRPASPGRAVCRPERTAVGCREEHLAAGCNEAEHSGEAKDEGATNGA